MGKKTLGRAFEDVQSFRHQIAINRTMLRYLQTKYMPRDSVGTPAQINCDGAPVPQSSIEEAIARLQVEINDMEAELKDLLKAEVT